MAVTYPRRIEDIFCRTAAVEATFHLPPQVEQSDPAVGGPILANYADRMWAGMITIRPYPTLDMDPIAARIEALLAAGRPVLLSRTKRRFPVADPSGAILGAATPSVSALAANNRDLTIAGLPAGYVLRSGDHLGFEVSGVPHLHRVVEDATESGGALTVEVDPVVPVDPVGAAVVLDRPVCKAVVLPTSYAPPTIGDWLSSGVSFSWAQVSR